jgi:hypothetical protein
MASPNMIQEGFDKMEISIAGLAKSNYESLVYDTEVLDW